MMHQARRASLVVALLLLASVGAASAECAWLLWMQGTGTLRGKTEKVWEMYDTTDTQEGSKARFPPRERLWRSVCARVATRLACFPVELSGG